jgi:hypothetical protein
MRTRRHIDDSEVLFPNGPTWAGLFLLGALLLGGCATPGPNHVYTVNFEQPATISDLGPAGAVAIPSFTTAEDKPSGLAYDPYTDHLFLRLAPGNKVRVVDRPDRKVKREFTIPELPSAGGGDLAVRPRDGHIFFACPPGHFVVETDRFGKFVRRFELAGRDGEVSGIAYDAERNRLFIATRGPQPQLGIHDLDGKLLRSFDLAIAQVRSLAYDATTRELHAVAGDESAILVLNEDGKVLRREPAREPVDFVDLGQRSFVRVF